MLQLENHSFGVARLKNEKLITMIGGGPLTMISVGSDQSSFYCYVQIIMIVIDCKYVIFMLHNLFAPEISCITKLISPSVSHHSSLLHSHLYSFLWHMISSLFVEKESDDKRLIFIFVTFFSLTVSNCVAHTALNIRGYLNHRRWTIY